MKHFGDITKINGAEVPAVDVVVGGSPCQDLSKAGHGEGIRHAALGDEETTRSGLFMDQVRIVKEMRYEEERRGRDLSISGTNDDIRYHRAARYMLWENVTGALQSSGGNDFKAVLEETVKIVTSNCPAIPIPEGGWPYAGSLEGMGDNGRPFSISWRTTDSQFWGVPQRRRRLSLIADFGGRTAPEILFESPHLSSNPQESESPRETASRGVGEGPETAIGAVSFQERAGRPGGGKGILIANERTAALRQNYIQAVSYMTQQRIGVYKEIGVASAVKQRDYKDPTDLVITPNEGTAVVRRLTPKEAERLQGFPDDWTNIGDWTDSKGKRHKLYDTDRFRALGNSIALPYWEFLAGRIVAALKRDGVNDPTMCSLFDGIGGFPLVFKRNGCEPIWASEIEEFPIAVTKIHFPE